MSQVARHLKHFRHVLKPTIWFACSMDAVGMGHIWIFGGIPDNPPKEMPDLDNGGGWIPDIRPDIYDFYNILEII